MFDDGHPTDTEVFVGGVLYRRGAAVRLVPGLEATPGLRGRAGFIDAMQRDEAGRLFLVVCLETHPGEDEMIRIHVAPAEVDLIE